MTKFYKITLQGCDDSTYIPIKLDDSSVQSMEELSKLSKRYSSYGCMPIMSIEEIEKETYWDIILKEGF